MNTLYKNKTGDVFAYTQTQLDTVANIDNPDYEFPIPREFYDLRDKLKGMTELTGDELEAHLNPQPTPEQLADTARTERNKRLAETDYMVMPDYPIGADKLDAVKA